MVNILSRLTPRVSFRNRNCLYTVELAATLQEQASPLPSTRRLDPFTYRPSINAPTMVRASGLKWPSWTLVLSPMFWWGWVTLIVSGVCPFCCSPPFLLFAQLNPVAINFFPVGLCNNIASQFVAWCNYCTYPEPWLLDHHIRAVSFWQRALHKSSPERGGWLSRILRR